MKGDYHDYWDPMRNNHWLAICLLVFVAACSQQPRDVQYWVEHPDALQQGYKDCNGSQGTKAIGAECKVIAQAVNKVRDLMLLSLQNRQAFGIKLLEDQMLLSQYQQALLKLTTQQAADTKLSSLQQADLNVRIKALSAQVRQQQSLVKQYLAIIKLEGIG